MIKKNFYFAAIAAIALSTAACSNETDAPVPGNDGLVTFTAQLPSEFASRAEFNTGTQANTLSYAVYEAGTDKVIYASTQADAPQGLYKADNMTFTLSLNLVKGQTYDFIFWADKGDSEVYKFSPEDKTVTISYENLEGNDDSRDAFFNVERNFTVTGAAKKNIELRRPFAQLNIGTNDIDVAKRAGIELGTTTVTVTGAYNTLNLLTGVASNNPAAEEGTVVSVTYPAHGINEGYAFPVDGTPAYTHLSMNYVLTGSVILDSKPTTAQKENKDVEIAFADVNGKEINSFKLSAVPVQRNYRTNIFGSLLTSQVDYIITIEPGINEGFDLPVDGYYVNAEGNYVVTSIDGLRWVASKVNDGSDNFNGKTILLAYDIDMKSVNNWTPIGNGTTDATGFKGTFDGQGHTISNFTMTDASGSYVGLFGYLRGGTVKNLNLTDVKLTNITCSGGIGAVAGGIFPSGLITNCTVDGLTISGNRRIGGIAGQTYGSLTNNTVKNFNITMFFDVKGTVCDNADKAGAIVGMMCESKYLLSGNTVSDGTITAYRDLGSIVGHAASPVIDNTASNVTLNYLKLESGMTYDGNKANQTMGEIYGALNASYVTPEKCTGNVATDITLNKE